MLAAHIDSFRRILFMFIWVPTFVSGRKNANRKRLPSKKWRLNSFSTRIKCTSKKHRFLTLKSPYPISTNASITHKERESLEKCATCHMMIHPNFAGRHKCGHANCPICREAILNSEYWSHIRSHPGHESDVPLTGHVHDFRNNMHQRPHK